MMHLRSLLCAVTALTVFGLTSAQADDWPQWLGPKRDGVWRETGILDTFPKEGPTIKWKMPIGGGYAGPSVVKGKVIVTDRQLADGEKNPTNPFDNKPVKGKERVLCLDENTGKELWKHEYDCTYEIQYPAGPRAHPVITADKVYTLGAMGDLFCLELDSGKVVWHKNFVKDYKAKVPIWGFAAHPLLHDGQLICLVGGQGTAVVAFDPKDGKEIWKSLSTNRIGYCPPTIVERNGKQQLIIWHAEAINGLEPKTGKVLWTEKFEVKADLSVSTPRLDGDRLFITSFYNSSQMLQIDFDKGTAKVLWKGKGGSEQPGRTDTLHSIMPTPFFKGEHIYGICSYGELRCLKAADGARVWMSLKATGNATEPVERWANAFLVEHEDRFFVFNEKGDLIIAKLTPEGYKELSRAHVIDPTGAIGNPRRNIVWTHPAFANKCAYIRNDKEIVCVSLAK